MGQLISIIELEALRSFGIEKDDNYEVSVDLPGFKKEEMWVLVYDIKSHTNWSR